MSGETEKAVSGWTVDTLKELFSKLREDDQLALRAALAAAEKANDKAEKAQQGINKTQNEFRGTLKDQAATLMPIKEAEAKFDDIQKQINSLLSVQTSSQGKSFGLQAGWGYLTGAIGLAAIIISVILAFNN